MDEKALELAEAAQLAMVDAGIAKVSARTKQQPANYDGLCVECGESIGDARLKFGAVTCIDCQEHLERIARSGR